MKLELLVVGPIGTNCLLVYDEEKRAAIVDPGDSPARLISEIQKLGLTLEYIFLTHGHFDHILAVRDVKAATGARIVIHKDDAYRLTSPSGSLASAVARIEHAAIDPDELADDGSAYTVGALTFTYVHTPGHTEGSCVILCGDRMFAGDTLFQGDCGRCDLPGGDYEAMLRSLKKLHDLPGDYVVYPGHGPKTTLEEERKNNPYMREGVNRY